jgi:hypothetical protein
MSRDALPKKPRARNVLLSEFPGLSKENASQALRDMEGDIDAARLLLLRAARKSKRARAWHPDENVDDSTRNARKRMRQDHELREEAKEDVREELRNDPRLRNEVRSELRRDAEFIHEVRHEVRHELRGHRGLREDVIDELKNKFRNDPRLVDEARSELHNDQYFRVEVANQLYRDRGLRADVADQLYNDASLRDATLSSLREDPTLRDEACRKVADQLYHDAGFLRATVSWLRKDPALRDEAFRKVTAEERAGRFDSARRTASLDGAWREISILPAVTQYDRYSCVALDLADPVAELLGAMLCGTVRAHRGLPPARGGTGTHVRRAPEFEIVAIERICNLRLRTQYVALRDSIRGKHDNQAVPQLFEVTDFGDVEFKHFQSINNSLFNERFLFHGAPMERVEEICKGGLDHRRAGTNAGALFGIGTYLAEDASKSDIYAKPDSSGLRCILVCRTCLGNTCYMNGPDQSLTMPPKNGDSVTALRQDEGGCLEHREYIVYDRAQAVPEFRVFYRHAARCQCCKCVL